MPSPESMLPSPDEAVELTPAQRAVLEFVERHKALSQTAQRIVRYYPPAERDNNGYPATPWVSVPAEDGANAPRTLRLRAVSGSPYADIREVFLEEQVVAEGRAKVERRASLGNEAMLKADGKRKWIPYGEGIVSYDDPATQEQVRQVQFILPPAPEEIVTQLEATLLSFEWALARSLA